MSTTHPPLAPPTRPSPSADRADFDRQRWLDGALRWEPDPRPVEEAAEHISIQVGDGAMRVLHVAGQGARHRAPCRHHPRLRRRRLRLAGSLRARPGARRAVHRRDPREVQHHLEHGEAGLAAGADGCGHRPHPRPAGTARAPTRRARFVLGSHPAAGRPRQRSAARRHAHRLRPHAAAALHQVLPEVDRAVAARCAAGREQVAVRRVRAAQDDPAPGSGSAPRRSSPPQTQGAGKARRSPRPSSTSPGSSTGSRPRSWS